MNTNQRRLQVWALVGYALSVLAMNFMDHGVRRKVVQGIAAVVLAVAVTLIGRARLRDGCARGSG